MMNRRNPITKFILVLVALCFVWVGPVAALCRAGGDKVKYMTSTHAGDIYCFTPIQMPRK